jgi:predicted SnoaL-like aldol condensation-catalyzing enzyme
MAANSNKALVVEAERAMFDSRDPAVVDRYVSSDYRQHSTLTADGPEALREMVAGLGPDAEAMTVRVLADGDLVATHTLYRGRGPQPLVVFDVFRVEGGKLVEHWDAHQALEARPVNPHSQLDGPAEITRPEQTEATRNLAERFIDTFAIAEEHQQLSRFCATDLVQHNPTVGDGVAGLALAMDELARQGRKLEFDRRHFTVADGEFALIATEGRMGSTPTAFYDLFRVSGDRIVEHWDVVNEIPVRMPHANGPF